MNGLKKRKKVELKVVLVPTEGDVLEKLIDAYAPNIGLALMKHGATLKMDIREFLRNLAVEEN